MSGLWRLLWGQHVLHSFPHSLNSMLSSTKPKTFKEYRRQGVLLNGKNMWQTDIIQLPPQIFSFLQDHKFGWWPESGCSGRYLGGDPAKHKEYIIRSQYILFRPLQSQVDFCPLTVTHPDSKTNLCGITFLTCNCNRIHFYKCTSKLWEALTSLRCLWWQLVEPHLHWRLQKDILNFSGSSQFSCMSQSLTVLSFKF